MSLILFTTYSIDFDMMATITVVVVMVKATPGTKINDKKYSTDIITKFWRGL